MTRAKKYPITRTGPIARWDEGIPLGNGLLGNLIYGEDVLTFSLDRGGLWDLTPVPEAKEPGFRYENLVRLVKSGKTEDWNEAMRLFDGCYNHATPTKVNAGKIVFDYPIGKNTEFCLNIDTGIASVRDGVLRMETFMSATRQIGVANIEGDFDISYTFAFPSYFYGEAEHSVGYPMAPAVGENTKKLGYAPPQCSERNGICYITHQMHDGTAFGIAWKERPTAKGKELRFYVLCATNVEAGFLQAEDAFARADVSYGQLRREHVAWWKTYWSESELSVPDRALEQLYYQSYYLFASCSRRGCLPMPLQGLWTACEDCLPPWKGDYHHDTNTQFSYVSYHRANHVDAGYSFIEYLWNGKAAYEQYTRDFYGVEGLLIPGVEAPDRQPLGGWPMYSLSPTMTIWAAKSFDDYYTYCCEETFLKERAYPFFKGVSNAITALLEEREDGFLYLPLSSSPEYGDCTPASYMKGWSNNDLQLVRYLYEVMIRYAKLRSMPTKEYEDVLSKLPGLFVDRFGVLQLNEDQYVEETHRHHSNVMCIYPLQTVCASSEEGRRIIDANIKRLERLGTGYWVGFSFPWFAAVCAMGYHGNRALFALQTFARCFVGDNGFHLNGDFKEYGVSQTHYRPFTLEASFGFCDALQQMLVQDHEDFLHLFPAIPMEWKHQTLSFSNFWARGDLHISATYACGAITECTVVTNRATEITVKNTFGKELLRFSDGQTVQCAKGELFALRLSKGTTSLLKE